MRDMPIILCTWSTTYWYMQKHQRQRPHTLQTGQRTLEGLQVTWNGPTGGSTTYWELQLRLRSCSKWNNCFAGFTSNLVIRFCTNEKWCLHGSSWNKDSIILLLFLYFELCTIIKLIFTLMSTIIQGLQWNEGFFLLFGCPRVRMKRIKDCLGSILSSGVTDDYSLHMFALCRFPELRFSEATREWGVCLPVGRAVERNSVFFLLFTCSCTYDNLQGWPYMRRSALDRHFSSRYCSCLHTNGLQAHKVTLLCFQFDSMPENFSKQFNAESNAASVCISMKFFTRLHESFKRMGIAFWVVI